MFDQWKIGRKDVDDGVLLIVAKDDHKRRIETGYGLEGAIPDARPSRIIREYITPQFRANDYYGGIQRRDRRADQTDRRRTAAAAGDTRASAERYRGLSS